MRRPVQYRLLAKLSEHKGVPVSIDDLIDAIYGDDETGGPLDAVGNIRVALHNLREKGFRIECRSFYTLK